MAPEAEEGVAVGALGRRREHLGAHGVVQLDGDLHGGMGERLDVVGERVDAKKAAEDVAKDVLHRSGRHLRQPKQVEVADQALRDGVAAASGRSTRRDEGGILHALEKKLLEVVEATLRKRLPH
eukprot:scaffold4536_cov113-Isochrysis_galbana.AAC.10